MLRRQEARPPPASKHAAPAAAQPLFPGLGSARLQAELAAGRAEAALEADAIATGDAPPIVHDVVASPGAPLDASIRSSMEPAFGLDLSAVRVHVGEEPARSARAVGALAYTVGEHVVFGDGRWQPGNPDGRRLLAHELTHVVQQASHGAMVQRQADPSATAAADPERPTAPPPPRQVSESGVVTPPPTVSTLGNAGAVSTGPPAVTTVGTPEGARIVTPDAAVQQRLLQIVRQGGPLPVDTRVIGAAIVEVDGFRGAREIRAISSSETDALGQGAPVFHATTPPVRTITAARSIGGASLRREFPFSHVNDAEIKLLEYISANLPANATGRITLMTMRSRQGGAVLEPIAACSSCTNALFQFAGRARGVQVGSFAPTPRTGSLDLGAQGGGGGPTGTTQTVSTRGGLTAQIGTPDMRGLASGGPSARGVGIGAGIQVVFMGLNFVLGLANDSVQRSRAEEELARIEPALQARRRENPRLGVLLVFFYTQVQAPPDSLIQPGAVFGHIEYGFGINPDEARDAWQAEPALRPGLSPTTSEHRQEVWIPPILAPSVADLRTPFPSVAVAGFASGRTTLQDVEWGGVTGFDDSGTSSLSGAAAARFLVLRPPATLSFYAAGSNHDVAIPIENRAAHVGGSIPVVQLDPSFPGSDVTAACVFPADDATAALFATAPRTQDNLNLLGRYVNFRRVRWVRPENVEVVRRL